MSMEISKAAVIVTGLIGNDRQNWFYQLFVAKIILVNRYDLIVIIIGWQYIKTEVSQNASCRDAQ